MKLLIKSNIESQYDGCIEAADRPDITGAADVVKSAPDAAGTLVIIEEDGMRGYPRAFDAYKRKLRRDPYFRLIYGASFAVRGGMGGRVIIIPKDQQGVTQLYRLITRLYLEYYDEGPYMPESLIDESGITGDDSGLICIRALSGEDGCSVLDVMELEYSVREPRPYPEGMYWPEVKDCEETVTERAMKRAREIYGDPLPDEVMNRLQRELSIITRTGYSEIFAIAMLLTDKAREDGQPFGFRGLLGSSLAAMMLGITDVNPLPPHYYCPECGVYENAEPAVYAETPYELPARRCPCCGAELKRDGYRIPMETLFGLMGDRTPDINLNFAKKYRPAMIRLLEKTFEGRVFTGGTGANANAHPGALFILPEGHEIFEFTPLMREGNDKDGRLITHLSTLGLDVPLLRVNVFGTDEMSRLRELWEITGIPACETDPGADEVLDMITFPRNDTRGIPEFDNQFVEHIMATTEPRTVADLIRISGLAHGTGAWTGNAENLITSYTAYLNDVITTREDIMNDLILIGMDDHEAYEIMSRVRKGRPLTEMQTSAMREAGVPEWYINSCYSVQYVFPRAHTVSYALNSLRLAWYKAHYPKVFKALNKN